MFEPVALELGGESDGDDGRDAFEDVAVVRAFDVRATRVRKHRTGIEAWDRVLSGGIVQNVMVSGPPASGKSTAAALVATTLALELGGSALYLACEPGMTCERVKLTAARGGADLKRLFIAETRTLREALAAVEKAAPAVVLWDSVSRVSVPRLSDEAALRKVIAAALDLRRPSILIAHSTKAGDVAVPQEHLHDVEAAIYVERERVTCTKNRDGVWPKSESLTGSKKRRAQRGDESPGEKRQHRNADAANEPEK